LASPPLTSNLKNKKIGELEFHNGAENLFALHERVRMYKVLTLQSIILGVDAALYAVDVEKASLIPFEREATKDVPTSTRKMFVASNKLGKMFGAYTRKA